MKVGDIVFLAFFASGAAQVCAASADENSLGVPSPIWLFQGTTAESVDLTNTYQPVPVPLTATSGDSPGMGDPGLTLTNATRLETLQPPSRIVRRLMTANEITIEAWLKAANTTQSGPARILTLSSDASHRNFTLGQEGDRIDFRLRTTQTSENGIPSLKSPPGTITTDLQHIMATRDRAGISRLYVNGQQVSEGRSNGELTNWADGMQLAIGDELSGGRPWNGTIYRIALYRQALTPDQVTKAFSAGSSHDAIQGLMAAREQQQAERQFETRVAPLLARHCLECHDAASSAGGLNLAEKTKAFSASDSGRSLIPGHADDSLLWQLVEADEMPKDRTPLTDEEKEALREWLQRGAVWSLDVLDPAVYQHSGGPELRLRRLTVTEYIRTIRQATGIDVEQDARRLLPVDVRADGFSNTSYNLKVDLQHVTAYAQLAEIVVSQLDAGEFVGRFSDRRKFTDKDMGEVISSVGEFLLRGPVSTREVIAYRGVTTSAAASGASFDEAMSLLLEAMLQSPRFLYRVERAPPEGSSTPAAPYEMASRLSYIIWGGPPDAVLMKAAAEGRLNVAEQADRMLADPRARERMQEFFADWLNLNRLNNLRPNADRFPQWSPTLADSMRRETLAYCDYVVWEQNKPLSALMNTPVTFVTPELAALYELPVSATNDQELQRCDLNQHPVRGGLLTQGSLLTIGGDNASMVTRGLMVMHELLRGVVNDPPPCVDTTPQPTMPGRTQRDMALERIANPGCGGCHQRFEPLAFGLERFDGIGRYQPNDEHGNVLREDGEILFPGSASAMSYTTSAELMDLLAESDRVSQSLTWKVAQFALGRPLTAADAATMQDVCEQAAAGNNTWAATMKAIVTSDLVTMKR